MAREFKLGVCALLFATAGATVGCSAMTWKPHMGFGNFDIQTQMQRKDVVVLDDVEGRSSTFTFLFGLVQVIDDSKWQVLGIKLFKDKYTPFKGSEGFTYTQDRAYYKALEQHADADTVFVKSWQIDDSGLPLIWYTNWVTVKGKAVKIKPDAKQ